MNVTFNASAVPTQLSVRTAVDVLPTLALFVGGIVLYSVFIFKFYRLLAERDVLKLDLGQYNTSTHAVFRKVFAVFFYILEYLLFIPLLSFFWFAVLTVLLSFLSRQDSGTIMLVSFAIIAAVRVTAYYTEDLSRDLAKMLPFALLAVFLVDMNYIDIATSFSALKEITSSLETLVYYFLFVVVLEFVMRIIAFVSASKEPPESK
ncbi:hypothetical protein D6789_03105 [Candidatus Woesearchaeota archaeon]|nr:MAG: hypothetical protein D6789_03105 [Candidatus Woesearchaeota archaeon]